MYSIIQISLISYCEGQIQTPNVIFIIKELVWQKLILRENKFNSFLKFHSTINSKQTKLFENVFS